MKASIQKTNGNLNVAKLSLPSHAEYCLTACGNNAATMNDMIRKSTKQYDAVILDRFVFAGCKHYKKFSSNVKPSDGRIVWLQGDACHDGEILSMQGFAMSGMKVKSVVVNGRSLGFCYEDEHACYCRLSGVTPANFANSNEQQTREVFESIRDALEDNGFDFTDIVRTWFYNRNILDWYAEFNSVRTEFFKKHGTFDKMVPASTGIGAANALGPALVTNVFAVKIGRAHV